MINPTLPRQNYKIKQGSITRMEQRTPRKVYKTYGIGEVIALTADAARQYGLEKLEMTFDTMIRTDFTPSPVVDEPERVTPAGMQIMTPNLMPDVSEAGRVNKDVVKSLIAEGEAATTGPAGTAWRANLRKSKLFTQVPKQKQQALDALRGMLQE